MATTDKIIFEAPVPIAQELSTATQEYLTDLLMRGLREARIERALARYRLEGISFAASAQAAGVSQAELARQASFVISSHHTMLRCCLKRCDDSNWHASAHYPLASCQTRRNPPGIGVLIHLDRTIDCTFRALLFDGGGPASHGLAPDSGS